MSPSNKIKWLRKACNYLINVFMWRSKLPMKEKFNVKKGALSYYEKNV